MDSILTSIKKLLGIDASYTHFDQDIIMHINSVFAILNQLGVGPEKGFRINGSEETWATYLGNDALLEDVKTYVYLKVQLMFDPPTISAVLESKTKLASELEWRISVAVENPQCAEAALLRSGSAIDTERRTQQ